MHPLFKGDDAANYRQKALAHYEPICSICGYDKKAVLQVHHIDGDRGNNSLENLVVLCPTHHVEAHVFGLKTIAAEICGTLAEMD